MPPLTTMQTANTPIRARRALVAGAALAFAAMPSIATAQRPAPSAEELQSRYEEKLKKDFVSNAPWQQDLEAAKAAAKESGKPIFAYFTRSYSP